MGFKVDEVFVDFLLDFREGEKGAQRINREMAKMGKNAGVAADAQDRLERSTRRTAKGTKQARDEMGRFGKKTKGVTSDLKRMIKTLIGLEVARRVVRALLNTFVNFRAEMNNVRAITNATDAQFERLKGTALELGRTTQFTATDAGRAMAFLARTGLDVNQAIAVLPGTLNLAAATAVDLATAADLSTNILKGMGLEISELDGLVDILAKTTNSANVDIFELGEAMKAVAPLAASVGMEVEETAAIIGKLGDAGIKGSLAGTAMRRALINLTTGAEGAQAVIDRLGLTIFDTEGNFVGLTSVIGQLGRANLEAGDEFKLFGARGLAAAQVLRRAGEEEIAAFTEELKNAEGTAKRMAEQQMAGLPGSLKLLTSATESTAIAWGTGLEPALSGVAKLIRVAVLPVFNGILATFKLVGPATFLMVEAFLFGARSISAGMDALVGLVISGFGFLTERLGELVSLLPGKLGDLGEKMQEFGDSARSAGQALRDSALDGFDQTLDQLRFAAEAAKGELVEIANDMTGTVAPAADETTDALDQLAGAVGETAAAMQRARTQLNLDVFTMQLEAVRALLRETFGIEGAGALGLEARLEIQRQLVGMTDDQVAAATALVQAEQDLAGAVRAVLDVQTELNEAGEDQEKIAELTEELEQAVSALAAATRDADAAMEDLGGKGKDVGEVLGNIALAVRGINRLADAFGLVNDDVRKAIDSVLDLISAFRALQAAKGAVQLGTVLGLAGGAIGALGALGGLFGGGADPAAIRREKERQDLLRANNLALEQLRISFERSLAVLQEFTGADIIRAQELLQLELDPAGIETEGRFERTGRRLTEAELAFLEDVAESFGITLDGTAESFRALDEAIAGLDLTRLTEMFTGAMDMLERRFRLFDIDKPIDRLEAWIELVREFGDIEIPDFDLSTEAGRAAMEAWIQGMFEQIEAGTFDISQLGGLTLQEWLDVLDGWESLLDDAEKDRALADEGLTENFVRSTRITEVQGNELLTLARTELIVERQQLAAQLEMVNLLGAMAGIGAPAPAATAAAAPATVVVGGVTINAAITVTEEVDPDALVERLGTDLAAVLDRMLSELQTREDRAVGDVGRVA